MTNEQRIAQQADAFIASLIDIEIELTTMKRRAVDARERVGEVKTLEDARQFNEWYRKHQLDDGLNFIELKTQPF